MPDEKVPESRKFSLPCPKCSHKIIVDKDKSSDILIQKELLSSSTVEKSGMIEPEIFPPGAKVVFLCGNNKFLLDQVEGYYAGINFCISRTKDSHEAMQRLMLNRYDAVFIEDNETYSDAMNVIAGWQGILRRNVNVMVYGNMAKSMDPKESFLKSANFYVNEGDIKSIEKILKDIQRGFSVYNDPWLKAAENLEG